MTLLASARRNGFALLQVRVGGLGRAQCQGAAVRVGHRGRSRHVPERVCPRIARQQVRPLPQATSLNSRSMGIDI